MLLPNLTRNPLQLCLCLTVLAAFPLLAKDKAVSLSTLKNIQSDVQAVLEVSSPSVISIECGSGTASGVIVSPSGLVLTAAHVVVEPGNKFNVTLHDGRTVEGTSLGVDNSTDTGMLQLPAPAKAWPYAPINRETHKVQPGDWCFALGHPNGYDASRGPVLRVGRLVKVSSNMLQSDCVIMPGDSGGPLFNMDGEVIGIHSQIWQGREQNLHASMAPFLRSWDELKSGSTITIWQQGSGGWIGISTVVSETGSGLRVRGVAPDSPAEKAQLKEGDTIISVNNQPMHAPVDFSDMIRRRPAGELVVLRIKSTSGERTVEIKLGKRPES